MGRSMRHLPALTFALLLSGLPAHAQTMEVSPNRLLKKSFAFGDEP
jgi:hypothetical protein